MKVIINADDFGLTEAVNKGIIKCYQEGVLTSTTLLANSRYFNDAVLLAQRNPGLGVGVHMALTLGQPILDSHKTLIDENGNFRFRRVHEIVDIDPEEVYREWDAQIHKVCEHLPITHLDSHHHVHMFVPELNDVALRLGKKYGVPVRWSENKDDTCVKYDGHFYADNVNLDYFKDLIKKNETRIEVMSHPALQIENDDIFSISSYVEPRFIETSVLTDPELRKLIHSNDIELISYRDI